MDFSELTEEEKIIVRDCQRKNFWGRALPLSLGAMVGCQVLVARGTIKKSLFKTFGFGLAGYILGRVSLPSQIKDRLLKEAPDGALARMTRQMQNMSLEERKEFLANLRNKGPPIPTQWEGVTGSSPVGSGTAPSLPEKPMTSSDDYPRQSHDADVRLKPSLDYDPGKKLAEDKLAEKPVNPPQRFSYAEQRKTYMQSESGGDRQLESSKSRSSEDFQETETSPPVQSNRKSKKNIYGDEME